MTQYGKVKFISRTINSFLVYAFFHIFFVMQSLEVLNIPIIADYLVKGMIFLFVWFVLSTIKDKLISYIKPQYIFDKINN